MDGRISSCIIWRDTKQDMTNFGPFLLAYTPMTFGRKQRDLALDAVDPNEENPWIRAYQYIEATKEINEQRRLGQLVDDEEDKQGEVEERQTQEEMQIMEVYFNGCTFEVSSCNILEAKAFLRGDDLLCLTHQCNPAL